MQRDLDSASLRCASLWQTGYCGGGEGGGGGGANLYVCIYIYLSPWYVLMSGSQL